VLLGDVVDKFHNEDGLTDTGTTEETNLTTTSIWVKKVDNLDTGDEDGGRGILIGKGRSVGVDRKGHLLADWSTLIDRLTDDVDNASKELVTDWDIDRSTLINHLLATLKTLGGIHSNSADGVLTKMLSDLEHDANVVVLDLESIQNVWELAIELDVDDGTNDLGDGASTGGGLGSRVTHLVFEGGSDPGECTAQHS
jgi:hypothetical protein